MIALDEQHDPSDLRSEEQPSRSEAEAEGGEDSELLADPDTIAKAKQVQTALEAERAASLQQRRRLTRVCCIGGPIASLLVLLYLDIFDLRDLLWPHDSQKDEPYVHRPELLEVELPPTEEELPSATNSISSPAAAPAPTPTPPSLPRWLPEDPFDDQGVPWSCYKSNDFVAFPQPKDANPSAKTPCKVGADISSEALCIEAARSLFPQALPTDFVSRSPCILDLPSEGAASRQVICHKIGSLPASISSLWSPFHAGGRFPDSLVSQGLKAYAQDDMVRPPTSWKKRPPRVGASIAIHPPKFYAAGNFLQEWASCPAAMEELGVFFVFSDEADRDLFLSVQECFSPQMPHTLWTAVVGDSGVKNKRQGDKQTYAAYKKWLGVAYMMDMPQDLAPDYGLMLDAEVALYHLHIQKNREGACSTGGYWSKLFTRIQAFEASKAFPAASIDTKTVYAGSRTGRDYDRGLIQENARFVEPSYTSCFSQGCLEVKRQIKDCLFSWWTNLPYVNLSIARRLFLKVAKGQTPEQAGGWAKLAASISWTRFEYIAYQQFCVFFEGFTFNDVTNLTLGSSWGSFLEDPNVGSNLAPLKPLWIGFHATNKLQKGLISPLSEDEPPLLLFHADYEQCRLTPPLFDVKKLWKALVLRNLQLAGRDDYPEDKLNRRLSSRSNAQLAAVQAQQSFLL